MLQELRNQGEVVINSRNNVNNFQQNVNSSNGSQSLPQSLSTSASSLQHRQQNRASSSPNNGDQLLWDSNNEATNNVGNAISSHVTTAKTTYASIVKPAAAISGQCIPGSNTHISVKPALAPSKVTNKFHETSIKD